MERFNKNALQALQQAGWFVGRKIDISQIKKDIVEHGMEVFPVLETFLEEFGLLRIEVLTKKLNKETKKVSSFFFERGLQEIETEFLEDYKKVIGCEKITVIGYMSSYWAVAIDELGFLYSIDLQNINRWGRGDSGLENLLFRNNYTKILLPDWWWEKY